MSSMVDQHLAARRGVFRGGRAHRADVYPQRGQRPGGIAGTKRDSVAAGARSPPHEKLNMTDQVKATRPHETYWLQRIMREASARVELLELIRALPTEQVPQAIELIKKLRKPAALICGHHCPNCDLPCAKKPGHAEMGYAGIAGLCWCTQCSGWWVAGEPTLLRDKKPAYHCICSAGMKSNNDRGHSDGCYYYNGKRGT
jgi:hypothetical protein